MINQRFIEQGTEASCRSIGCRHGGERRWNGALSHKTPAALITIFATGRFDGVLVGILPILSSRFSPSVTKPNATYLSSAQGALSSVMKNLEPFLLDPRDADDTMPM